MPEYLQVELTATKNGRDYITLLEGVERSKKFSVKAGNLKNGNPGYRGPVNLQFSLSKELLSYPGGQVKAITSEDEPIAVDNYPIQIPDFPHPKGVPYIGQSPYAKNWFFLGQGNAVYGSDARYLHPGARSLGCITVDPAGWARLYQALILCRRSDGKTIGMVSVVK